MTQQKSIGTRSAAVSDRRAAYRRYLMSPQMLRQSMQHLQDMMTRQSPPRLPSRPPLIHGRPALRGEIF